MFLLYLELIYRYQGFNRFYHNKKECTDKELQIRTVDIPVRDIDDGMMIKIMANENRDSYKTNRAVMIETVRVVRDWLRQQMEGEWDDLNKSIKILFESYHSFNQARTHGVGQTTILKFLGGDWKQWEIQEALAQIDDEDVDQKALDEFKTLSVAQAVRKAFKEHKVPKQKQKAVAKMLVDTETPVKKFHSKVAEVDKKEIFLHTAPRVNNNRGLP